MCRSEPRGLTRRSPVTYIKTADVVLKLSGGQIAALPIAPPGLTVRAGFAVTARGTVTAGVPGLLEPGPVTVPAVPARAARTVRGGSPADTWLPADETSGAPRAGYSAGTARTSVAAVAARATGGAVAGDTKASGGGEIKVAAVAAAAVGAGAVTAGVSGSGKELARPCCPMRPPRRRRRHRYLPHPRWHPRRRPHPSG